MSNLATFLRARIDDAAANGPCEGSGEYSSCDELSDRLKADTEAKGRVIDAYLGAAFALTCHPEDETERGYTHGLFTALRLLAQPYAAHPDFDPGWRVASSESP